MEGNTGLRLDRAAAHDRAAERRLEAGFGAAVITKHGGWRRVAQAVRDRRSGRTIEGAAPFTGSSGTMRRAAAVPRIADNGDQQTKASLSASCARFGRAQSGRLSYCPCSMKYCCWLVPGTNKSMRLPLVESAADIGCQGPAGEVAVNT